MATSRNNFDWSTHNGIKFFISIDDGFEGIVEDPKRKGKIDGDVFEEGCALAEQVLDNLNANSTHNHSSGGSNGRDDLTCNQFHLEVIHFLNLVVAGLYKVKFTLRFDTPPMNSIWKLEGSSFSNSTTEGLASGRRGY